MYCYADDIVIRGLGLEHIRRVNDIIEEWSNRNLITVNKEKSGIIIIRSDRRTRVVGNIDTCGYPIVQEYKYLGVLIDDCVTLKLEKKIKKELEKKLEKSTWILNSQKLNPSSRYQLWRTLFASKLWY